MYLSTANYFDDFVQVECKELAGNSQETFLAFAEVLGWAVALEPKKNRDFGEVFAALGVQFDLSTGPLGYVTVANKPERVRDLLRDLAVAEREGLTRSAAATLRGRLSYAEGQVFGRCASAALSVLGDGAALARTVGTVTPELRRALRWLRDFLLDAAPRVVWAVFPCAAKLVFTDGACEGDLVTCGAVLFDAEVERPEWFGLRVPAQVVERWRAFGPNHVVAQAELVPVLLARLTWASRLAAAPAVYYIDNEGVREALITGSTRSLASRDLLIEVAAESVKLGGAPWYSRVPSPSNVADGPSRLAGIPDGPWLRAIQVEPILPAWW